jgi:hypothetical protein
MARSNSASSWTGWIYFAGFLLILRGALEGIFGLVALLKDTYYVVAEESLVVFDYSTWGWLHLLAGLLVLWAGTALINGSSAARVVAIVLMGLTLIGNLLFISAYPFWGVFAVVVDLIILYALIVHGDEVPQE